MSQPSFLASGSTPLRTDTKSRIWTKILGKLQSSASANSKNDPKVRDPLRRTKVKILKSLTNT